MKKVFTTKASCFTKQILFAVILFSFVSVAYAHNPINSFKCVDTTDEKKVDYLEHIYFSGKNKQDLSGLILATLQQMESKPATTAVARQYTFLSGIKDKVDGAKNSCEVLQMLADGIYAIDANEAILMGIPKPKADSKASLNVRDAMSSLNSLNNSANTMALSSWALSGGKTSALSGGVWNATGKLGNGLAAGGQAIQMLDQGGKILKGLGFGGGDKACKEVPVKTIALGEHNAVAATNVAANNAPNNGTNSMTSSSASSAAATKIIVKNISYAQLSDVAASLEKLTGVSGVNSDDFAGGKATILVSHNIKIRELVNAVVKSNEKLNFEIESQSATEAILNIKTKGK